MKLRLFYNKSVHENAAYYYELAKETKKKIEGLKKAIKETEKELKGAPGGERERPRVKKERKWYEKFHYFFTSGNRLAIGGRSAQQNDRVVAKHMEDSDLFFHADIQGGSAVILKEGRHATQEEKEEAAQFAACFSRAWANANAAVDVYAVGKSQLSKHATGGYIPSGAFAISGEREWFRSTRLRLKIGLKEEKVLVTPAVSPVSLEDMMFLLPSKTGKEKGSLAKSLAKRYKVHPDELLEALPNGKSKTVVG
ncbi:DUF814 domain-containing protein [Candidatus Micrarchaeota archaeon]|nr:DUF814 domain-containing protein [Candidatus Micrarchaeota archaeon]